MPPRNTDFIPESNVQDGELQSVPEMEPVESKAAPMRIVWRNVVWFLYLHAMAVYGLYLLPQSQWKTMIFSKFVKSYL